MIEKIFQILAVILIGIAAFFLWKGNADAAFAAAVLGAVFFFLNIRFQAKERVNENIEEILEAQRLEENERQQLRESARFETEGEKTNLISDNQKYSD